MGKYVVESVKVFPESVPLVCLAGNTASVGTALAYREEIDATCANCVPHSHSSGSLRSDLDSASPVLTGLRVQWGTQTHPLTVTTLRGLGRDGVD